MPWGSRSELDIAVEEVAAGLKRREKLLRKERVPRVRPGEWACGDCDWPCVGGGWGCQCQGTRPRLCDGCARFHRMGHHVSRETCVAAVRS